MALCVTDVTIDKKDWRWVFLKALAESCCVSHACLVAKVSRRCAYWHRDRFPKFRKAWDEALEVGVEALEYEARHRAFNRADPMSHAFIMFLLKAHRPHKYRDNGHQIPVPPEDDSTDELTEQDLDKLSTDDLHTLRSISQKLVGEPGEAQTEDRCRTVPPVAC